MKNIVRIRQGFALAIAFTIVLLTLVCIKQHQELVRLRAEKQAALSDADLPEGIAFSHCFDGPVEPRGN